MTPGGVFILGKRSHRTEQKDEKMKYTVTWWGKKDLYSTFTQGGEPSTNTVSSSPRLSLPPAHPLAFQRHLPISNVPSPQMNISTEGGRHLLVSLWLFQSSYLRVVCVLALCIYTIKSQRGGDNNLQCALLASQKVIPLQF